MGIFDSAKKLFSPKPSLWAQAMSDDFYAILTHNLEPFISGVKAVPLVDRNHEHYDLFGQGIASNLYVGESANGKCYIVARDQSFGDSAALALAQQGWAPSQIAQLSILHELAHAAVSLRMHEDSDPFVRDDPNVLMKAWKMAFYKWPLFKPLGLPFRSIAAECKISQAVSPSGNLAYFAASATNRASIAWGSNLEELRADAFSVAVCASDIVPELANHPLRTNFSKALGELATARGNGASGDAYHWGRFRDAISLVDPKHSLSPLCALGVAEAVALICANHNTPLLVGARPENAKMFAELSVYFPDPQQCADAQYDSAMNILKTYLSPAPPQGAPIASSIKPL